MYFFRLFEGFNVFLEGCISDTVQFSVASHRHVLVFGVFFFLVYINVEPSFVDIRLNKRTNCRTRMILKLFFAHRYTENDSPLQVPDIGGKTKEIPSTMTMLFSQQPIDCNPLAVDARWHSVHGKSNLLYGHFDGGELVCFSMVPPWCLSYVVGAGAICPVYTSTRNRFERRSGPVYYPRSSSHISIP